MSNSVVLITGALTGIGQRRRPERCAAGRSPAVMTTPGPMAAELRDMGTGSRIHPRRWPAGRRGAKPRRPNGRPLPDAWMSR